MSITHTRSLSSTTEVSDLTSRGWLPTEPLVSALARAEDRPALNPNQDRQLNRAKSRGYISIWLADEICCHVLKVHPLLVFGDAWVDAIAAHDEGE